MDGRALHCSAVFVLIPARICSLMRDSQSENNNQNALFFKERDGPKERYGPVLNKKRTHLNDRGVLMTMENDLELKNKKLTGARYNREKNRKDSKREERESKYL